MYSSNEASQLYSSNYSAFTPVSLEPNHNATVAQGQGVRTWAPQQVKDLLDELCCKFLVNINEENRGDMTCMFFQAELAYWHYVDFYHEEQPNIYPFYKLKTFCDILFNQYPELLNHQDVSAVMEEWKKFKSQVPTYGAIIVDDTLEFCLLVHGYTSKACWGFPKGKIQTGESGEQCACREVYEETGLNLTNHLIPSDYIERVVFDRLVTLYVITGISKDTEFKAKTRNEIREYGWFKLADLPTSKTDVGAAQKLGLKPDAFTQVIPFLKQLAKILKSKQATRPSSGRAKHRHHKKSGKTSLTKHQQGSDDHCDELHAIFGITQSSQRTSTTPTGHIQPHTLITNSQDHTQNISSYPQKNSETVTRKQDESTVIDRSDQILRRLESDLNNLNANFISRVNNILSSYRRERLEACRRITQFDARSHLQIDIHPDN